MGQDPKIEKFNEKHSPTYIISGVVDVFGGDTLKLWIYFFRCALHLGPFNQAWYLWFSRSK